VAPSIGALLRQAREVRRMSAGDAARAAGISSAYLNRLENGGVLKPSPHVLHQLGEALSVPYAELLRLCGYRVPQERVPVTTPSIGRALFADLAADERDELLEYLAWYRARRRSSRGGEAKT
jgi:transcriptional regulator with XRE-family HTH domain